MSKLLITLAILVIGYLLGNISTGILISKRAGVNIRSAGSKSTGASNVLRVLGIREGVLTFLGDFTKAALACWIGSLLLPGATFGIDRFGIMMGGLAVIIGHNWPCFYAFKGGKGIASSTAVLLFVDPMLGGIAIALCLIVIAITRYISLGSLTMLFTFMVFILTVRFGQWFLLGFAVVLFVFSVVRHRANIRRLLAGSENKIGNRVHAEKTKPE
jgi:acyl phosphate:glycerol-3-phosphate acyltransferase